MISSQTHNPDRQSRLSPEVYKKRRIRAAVLGGGLLLGGVAGVDALTDGGQASPKPTHEYIVQPGDTAWEIGKKVEALQDGVADNQDVRPIVDRISKQSDGVLQVGERLQLPVDIYTTQEKMGSGPQG